MKHHARRQIISPKSRLYPALRWGFQPVKAIRRKLALMRWQPRIGRVIAEYLDRPGFKGLHVGCGPFHMDGWLNSELYGYHSKADFPQDITQPLPFPDNSLDVIYSAEVIEHITRADALRFMREAHRVLKPGGVLRMTTPDVVEVCRLFLGQRDDVSLEQFRATWLDGDFSSEIWVNKQFNDYGHQHLWSMDEMRQELATAGFANVTRCEPMQTSSAFSQLNGLETRYGKDAPPWLFARTLIVESEKPKVTSDEKRTSPVTVTTFVNAQPKRQSVNS